MQSLQGSGVGCFSFLVELPGIRKENGLWLAEPSLSRTETWKVAVSVWARSGQALGACGPAARCSTVLSGGLVLRSLCCWGRAQPEVSFVPAKLCGWRGGWDLFSHLGSLASPGQTSQELELGAHCPGPACASSCPQECPCASLGPTGAWAQRG